MNSIGTNDTATAPLDSCLLVDYRLCSRTRIRDFIRSTQLFDKVHEPGSLIRGLEMVSALRIETCVFGPSVKTEKIQEFIANTKLSEWSKDCAFVVFQSRDGREDVSGAHVVIESPCAQPTFNAGLVKALVEANGGSVPVSQRVDPTTGRPVSLKAALEMLELSENENTETGRANAQEGTTQHWTRQLVETVVRCCPKLHAGLLQLLPFSLNFRSNGEPSDCTVNAVRDLIHHTFAGVDDVPDLERFKGFLEPMLFQWIKRSTLQGRAAADFVLKRELRNCLKQR